MDYPGTPGSTPPATNTSAAPVPVPTGNPNTLPFTGTDGFGLIAIAIFCILVGLAKARLARVRVA